MNRAREFAYLHSLFHGNNQFQNCFARSCSYDRCAQDSPIRFGNNLQEARYIVFTHCAVYFAQLPAMHLNPVAML